MNSASINILGIDKSIVVLPFKNLSGDNEYEYFSDGITEEIINALAKIEGLRVIARTSAFTFKGKSTDIRIIGNELGVTNAVEGSIRISKDRIRISAQLTRTDNGYLLWSERFDRKLNDVFELQESELETNLNLKKDDDNLLLIGCSPCQFWSIINTDKSKSQKSKNLLIEFERFVKYFNPGYVVVENVPGVLRKKRESGLEKFIQNLENKNYTVHFKVHNTYEYGVPQSRKRFTLIANRISKNEIEPIKSRKKLTVKDVIGVENGFKKIKAGHKDESVLMHTAPSVSDLTLRRLKKVEKDGGNRLGFANDPELQLDCFKGRDSSFKDTFGRLWWDKPAPTITTKFFSVSNGRFVHPEENRALSIREGAVLQSFPKTFKFFGI